MMVLAGLGVVAFAGGGYWGNALAARGITADNALQRHQRQVYLAICLLLGLVTCLIVILKPGAHSLWVPAFLSMYIAAYFWHGIILLCCFSMGLLVFLEKPGWRNAQRLWQMIVFCGVGVAAIGVLLYQSWPITAQVQAPRIVNGVVLQTTPYSCAAATIATISRRLYPERQMTERQVVQLAGTSRQGTHTLAEIQTMEKLGLAPDFQRGLTIQDLVDRNQMAILHVMEPVGGTRIQHAIALLSIDSDKQTLTVGNPLYGQQIKTFADMQDYWLKEAVFVTQSQLKPP